MAEKKLRIATNTVEDVTFVKLAGVIDEDNELDRSARRLTGKTVVIDLAEVQRINSCGVRDWVNWLTELDTAGKHVVLARLSPCIVTQLNLVNNFVGRARVRSFFAPYYCARCDIEALCLLQVDDLTGQFSTRAPRPDDPRTPSVRCQKTPPEKACGLQFDDIEASYFAFLPRALAQAKEDEGGLEALSPTLRARIERLDKVAGDGSTPVSGSYSPLTSTSVSLARDGTPAPAEAPAPTTGAGRGTTYLLVGLATVLVGLIAYVVFVLGKG